MIDRYYFTRDAMGLYGMGDAYSGGMKHNINNHGEETEMTIYMQAIRKATCGLCWSLRPGESVVFGKH